MSDTAFDEADRLRSRQEAADIAATRPGTVSTDSARCQVMQTTTVSSYPTAASRFYAMKSVLVTGVEGEGSPGVLTPESTTIYALNLGSLAPPSGTNVLVTFVDFRWVFRYDG